jgi:hypothetical protein
MQAMTSWVGLEASESDDGRADILRPLIDGKVPVVLFRDLVPASVFDEQRTRAEKLFSHASTTRYPNGTLTTVGPYLAKYLGDLDGYFRAAAESTELLRSVAFELTDQICAALCKRLSLTSMTVAKDPRRGSYAEGVLRVHGNGVSNPLHNDNIMRDISREESRLADLRYQLSCVVCLQACDSGGELIAYQKSWNPEDEAHKTRDHLGYRSSVVEGVPAFEFKPSAGDVYLINPTYYHEIKQVSGRDRLTLGFFIGFADDRLAEAVIWG